MIHNEFLYRDMSTTFLNQYQTAVITGIRAEYVSTLLGQKGKQTNSLRKIEGLTVIHTNPLYKYSSITAINLSLFLI